jgi:predicted alpha/beta superfamily hydrolase
MIFELEASSASEALGADGQVFLSVGSEEMLIGEIPMVANTQALYERLALRQRAGFDTTLAILDGEMHHSTIPAAVSQGLRWLYR